MISRLAAVRAAASGYAAGLILVRTRYSSANLFQRNERKGWFSGHTAQCISVCVCVCVVVVQSLRRTAYKQSLLPARCFAGSTCACVWCGWMFAPDERNGLVNGDEEDIERFKDSVRVGLAVNGRVGPQE